jgi:predicted outer membrane repeat protein
LSYIFLVIFEQGLRFGFNGDSILAYTGLYSAFVDPDAGNDAICALNDAVACKSLPMALAQYVANERIINALYSSTDLSSVIVVNSRFSSNGGVISMSLPYSVTGIHYMIRGYYTLSPLVPAAKISCSVITAASAQQLLVDSSTKTSRFAMASFTIAPPCFTHSSNTVWLIGVTLLGAQGGAISMSSSATLNASSSTFTNNSAAYGGAIFATTSRVILTNSQLSYNSVNHSIVPAQTDMTLPSPGFGGGVYSVFSTVTLTSVQFINNTATLNGGGAYLVQCFLSTGICSSLQGCVQSTVFQSNYAGKRGGGMYLYYTQGTYTYGTVQNNSVAHAAGSGGAGIYQQYGVMSYTNVHYFGNYLVTTATSAVLQVWQAPINSQPGGYAKHFFSFFCACICFLHETCVSVCIADVVCVSGPKPSLF